MQTEEDFNVRARPHADSSYSPFSSVLRNFYLQLYCTGWTPFANAGVSPVSTYTHSLTPANHALLDRITESTFPARGMAHRIAALEAVKLARSKATCTRRLQYRSVNVPLTTTVSVRIQPSGSPLRWRSRDLYGLLSGACLHQTELVHSLNRSLTAISCLCTYSHLRPYKFLL